MKTVRSFALAKAIGVSLWLVGLPLAPFGAFAQGSLTPPGAPAPTMKTLTQVEPRTPISSLPFNITVPGSYYLVTNLTSSGNGITISTDGVTVDLMGFELAGGPGSVVGVNTGGGVRTNICVRNGTVRGWNGDGLNLFSGGAVVVEDLRALKNSGNGLTVGDGAVVRNCVASFNVIQGIVTGDGATVRRCTAYANGNAGITLGNACLVIDSASLANGNSGMSLGAGGTVRNCDVSRNASGIAAGANSLISGCVADDNGSAGVLVGERSTVDACQANGNRSGFGDGVSTGIRCTVTDCTTMSNSVNGIHVLGDSVVTGCHSSLNGRAINAAGIFTPGTGSRIENNQARDNAGYGIQATAADLVLRNSAGGNSTNYLPASGVNFGPIQSPATATNAWANFVF